MEQRRWIRGSWETSDNSRRKEKTLAAPPGMVGTLPSLAAAQEGGQCLIGKRWSAASSTDSRSSRTSEQKSSKNSPRTSTKLSKGRAGKDLQNKTPLSAVSARSRIGGIYAEGFKPPERWRTS